MEIHLEKTTDLVDILKKKDGCIYNKISLGKTLQVIEGLGEFNEIIGHMYRER